MQGDYGRAVGAYTRAIAAYQKARNERGIAETQHNLGIAYREQGRLDDAMHATDTAMREAERLGDRRLKAQALAGRAEIQVARGDPELAIREAQRAVVIHRDLKDAVRETEDLRILAVALGAAGRKREAEAMFREVIARAAKHERSLLVAIAQRDLAYLLAREGNIAAAREVADTARATLERLGAKAEAEKLDALLNAPRVEPPPPPRRSESSAADAPRHFLRAVQLGGASRELRARAEQNLGILASIQGDCEDALACYARSLEAYKSCNDEHGSAIAYHNLGMVSAQRQLLDEADGYFTQSYDIAVRVQDTYLQGLCLLNHAEVYFAWERYEEARRNAETALGLFEQVDSGVLRAQAYRIIGMVYRETGRPALGEARLRSALELAVTTGSVLNEAAPGARDPVPGDGPQ